MNKIEWHRFRMGIKLNLLNDIFDLFFHFDSHIFYNFHCFLPFLSYLSCTTYKAVTINVVLSKTHIMNWLLWWLPMYSKFSLPQLSSKLSQTFSSLGSPLRSLSVTTAGFLNSSTVMYFGVHTIVSTFSTGLPLLEKLTLLPELEWWYERHIPLWPIWKDL